MNKITHGIHKDENFWPWQIEAKEFIFASKAKFIAINAPTGTGKSIIGFESIEPPFFYLCSSIQLEHQLHHDFPEAKLLKGRGNYSCEKFDTPEVCYLPKNEKCMECEYEIAKKEALYADFTILNYHYFLAACNYAGFVKQGTFRNIILDEADNLDNILTSFISFDFSLKRLQLLRVADNLPKKKTRIESFMEWLKEVEYHTDAQLELLEETIDEIKRIVKEHGYLGKENNAMLKQYMRLKSLESKIQFLNTQELDDDKWTYYHNEYKAVVKPKWLTRELSDKFLFNYGSKFLFMSATLPSKEILCGLFGIEAKEMDYLELPHPFALENRKIFYVPQYNLTSQEKPDAHKIRTAVSNILSKERHRGIIHTVSYNLSMVLENLSSRLVFHNSNDKAEKFEYFLNAEGAIFVSPSSVRGLDLKDDMCRFIIFLKCPYLDLGDYHTSQRAYASGKWGASWYRGEAVHNIIQGCGRGVRHQKDFCVAYLLDKQIGKLLKKYPSLFPMWFRESIIY